MMIYRVIISIGYHNAWFDFDSIEEAGEFAKVVIMHGTSNEDTKKRKSVSLQIIDPSAKNENDDEEDE